VGVNGGGFDDDSDAALRRLDFGVVGTSGTTNSAFGGLVAPLRAAAPSLVDVADALLLRFLGATEALGADLAPLLVAPLVSGVADALPVEMRAERRRDIVNGRAGVGSVQQVGRFQSAIRNNKVLRFLRINDEMR
jgi:hypothetical protein